MPSRFLRSVWVAVAMFVLASSGEARAQVFSETFSSSSINATRWEYFSSASHVSFAASGGRLEFRTTSNAGVGPDMINYAAVRSRFAIGSVQDVRASIKLNYQWSAMSPSANPEGVGFMLTDVETEPVTGRFEGFHPGIIMGLSSAHMQNGGRIRYVGISFLQPDGSVLPVFYAEEIGSTGVFVDANLTSYTLPASGPVTVYVSYSRAESLIRISCSSFGGPYLASLPVESGEGRPVKFSLYGVATGPTAPLTGSRSWIDDFVVHQGAISNPPTNLVASQGSSTSAVNLSWSAASGATSYRVYRTSNLVTPIATVSGTSYADGAASPGVATQYCVRAFSAAAGLSEYSNFATGYKKAPAPTVTAVSPAVGPLAGGTTITVTGTNLRMASSVKVGTASATNVVVNSAGTSLTAKTPAGTAGAKTVSVTTPSGTATKANAFTYVAAPAITGVTPAAGPLAGGTTITVTGTNLLGTTSVKVGTASATNVVVNSAGTSLTAKTPAGTAGAKSVSVTTPSGTATTAANAFTYMAAPTIGTVTPASGPTTGNTTITVTGTNFRAGLTTVKIGTASATNVVVNATGTSLTAKTPAGTVGAKSVVVTAPGGTATKTNGFTYTAGAGMPAGGGSGSGSGGGSTAGMPSGGGSSGTGASTAASSAAQPGGRWQPTTGIPAVDAFLVIAGTGEAPEVDLDANGEADLGQLRRGDLDLDGDVDDADAELILALVGRESADGIADLDGDGWVTLLDAAAARPAGPTLGSTPR